MQRFRMLLVMYSDRCTVWSVVSLTDKESMNSKSLIVQAPSSVDCGTLI